MDVCNNITQDRIYPPEYEGHFSRLLIKREDIIDRATNLARAIHEDYKGKRPVLLCVLKGASSFYLHLLEALQDLRQGFYTEFIRLSSYEGSETTGKVKVGGGLNYSDLTGKDVIIIEDIIDTGTTLYNLLPLIKAEAKPKSVEVCSLLVKRLSTPTKLDAKYIGFSIPPQFVIGFGLDYNELYRDLKDIWVISQQGIDFDPKELHK
jgi:hypoxanthine phosphoribosyltransferase